MTAARSTIRQSYELGTLGSVHIIVDTARPLTRFEMARLVPLMAAAEDLVHELTPRDADA